MTGAGLVASVGSLGATILVTGWWQLTCQFCLCSLNLANTVLVGANIGDRISARRRRTKLMELAIRAIGIERACPHALPHMRACAASAGALCYTQSDQCSKSNANGSMVILSPTPST